MKSWRLYRPAVLPDADFRLEERPVPQPRAGQVLIEVQVCGVCHTDLHTLEGDITPPVYPITPGHQVVGRIAALGEGVTTWRVGQRVGVPWLYAACGECEFCQRGQENLCPQARFTGFHADGGYAEFMLADTRYVLPLPESISDEQAAPLLCAGIIGYRALHKADLQPGERLGLFGFGASAHLAIQVARHWGCPVYVFTRSAEHRQHALELGAVWVGGAEDEAPEPVDRAVIFAPAGTLVPLALKKLRPGGTLAINAIHMSPIPQMPYALIHGERTLRSVANATYQDGIEFLRLAAEIPVRADTQVYPLEEARRALDDLKHSHIRGEAVLSIGD